MTFRKLLLARAMDNPAAAENEAATHIALSLFGGGGDDDAGDPAFFVWRPPRPSM
jgi:hypothetical protein